VIAAWQTFGLESASFIIEDYWTWFFSKGIRWFAIPNIIISGDNYFNTLLENGTADMTTTRMRIRPIYTV
jgi:hypothetical protein